MRVLWVCNIMLPRVAKSLGLEASNKEGWLTGLLDHLLCQGKKEGMVIGVCFPVAQTEDGLRGEADGLVYYGFYEDVAHEERYDEALETRMQQIAEDFQPDVVHIFGTEFAHSLAMVKALQAPEKILVGLQGVCYRCAQVYTAGLPDRIVNRSLFRDFLKRDNIRQQQEKFVRRGEREKELLQLAGHVTGRTAFDKESAFAVNPSLTYHFMNETLRAPFYQGEWNYARCEKHSLFLSQGNYPLKGLHIVLEAAALLVESYSDIRIYVAGDVITAYSTWKEKLKIGSYGKYLLECIRTWQLEERICFLGRMNAEEMKKRYLQSNAYVSASILENSPNSVGEAMLLGVPVISSDGGGVSSMLTPQKQGWLFAAGQARELAACVTEVFELGEQAERIGRAAAKRARRTHDGEENERRLLEIYHTIAKS